MNWESASLETGVWTNSNIICLTWSSSVPCSNVSRSVRQCIMPILILFSHVYKKYRNYTHFLSEPPGDGVILQYDRKTIIKCTFAVMFGMILSSPFFILGLILFGLSIPGVAADNLSFVLLALLPIGGAIIAIPLHLIFTSTAIGPLESLRINTSGGRISRKSA